MNTPLVKNAADAGQVASAKEKVKFRRDRELDDLRKVLADNSGKRMLWRFLEHGKVFETIWEPSAKIHYNAGIQDFGHFIMAEILEADPNALLEMMKIKKGENENV